MKRKLGLCTAAAFMAAGSVFVLNVSTAMAATPPSSCTEHGSDLAAGVQRNPVDGAYVHLSHTYSVAPFCDSVYVGNNTQCATFRVVRLSPQPLTNGGWFRSCWTPQKGASSLGGWLDVGDLYYVEALDGSYPSLPYIHLWD